MTGDQIISALTDEQAYNLLAKAQDKVTAFGPCAVVHHGDQIIPLLEQLQRPLVVGMVWFAISGCPVQLVTVDSCVCIKGGGAG